MGDACWDISRFVNTDRINPEDSAVPLYSKSVSHDIKTAGMAGNLLVGLQKLESELTDFSVSSVLPDPKLWSTKTRFYSAPNAEYLFRYDEDRTCNSQLGYDESMLAGVDLVLVSDYNKGFITAHTLAVIVRDCYTANIPIIVDTKKVDLQELHGATIKINKAEAEKIKFWGTQGPNTIITLGELGAYYRGKVHEAIKMLSVDVCGAGDAFMQGLAFGMYKTRNIEDSIKYGIIASGVSVNYKGCYMPSVSQLTLKYS